MLLLQQLFVAHISQRFFYEVDLAHAPILAFVLSQIAAGLIFLLLLRLIPRVTVSNRLFLLSLLLGLMLRLFLFDSQPILEIDFYRYLWDGAVTANGFNPYRLAPDTVAQAGSDRLQRLAADAGPIIERINYGELRSIYPPLTQLVFAIAYLVDDWNLDVWRTLLLLFDIASLTIIYKILNLTNRSRLWSLLYWWNPLLIHETYNTLHMDVLILPFLLLALFLMIDRRFIAASGALTVAAGIKLWPLLLLPFSVRPLLRKPRQGVLALLIILAIAGIAIVPLFIFGLGENSGLLGYSQEWLRNSALFPLLISIVSVFNPGDSGLISRVFIGLTLVCLVFYLNQKPVFDPNTLVANLSWVITALFLLSPTQFPWYTIWFAPLLCFYPKPALLLLMGLMPIYYLRNYFAARDNVELFDNFIVWIQYLPVYCLLLVDFLQQRSHRSMAGDHV